MTRTRDEQPSDSRLKDEAFLTLKHWGWKPGDNLHRAQVIGLMVRFAKKAFGGELSCGYPACGCCADAACDEAQALAANAVTAEKDARIAELEKALAEAREDARRLDWLDSVPFADVAKEHDGWNIRINRVKHYKPGPTLRAAIDAAIAGEDRG